MVGLTSMQNDTYIGAYPLQQAVVIGNYSVTASVNSNGTYDSTTGYFNVILGGSSNGDNGLNVSLIAYDPVQKAFVMKASMASDNKDTPEMAVNDTPGIKGLSVKGVKVMQAASSANTGVKQAASRKQIEVIIPADDASMKTISQRYNISKDISRATTSDSISADGTRIHVSLNDKVDGSWYRMSVSLPPGSKVNKIFRADGTEITNNVMIDRTTGAVVNNDVNWYVDNGTLYFYDDPINGYDITLQPPMASNSLAVNVIYGGQLSAIVYPFNQTDTDAIMAGNDQLGSTGDNSYANDIDADAGSKTAVRMYANNNVKANNLMMFGNNGSNYDTYSNANYKYTDVGQPAIVGFNTVPDGSVESVVLSNYLTPQVTNEPSRVNITQKTIIRNNNLWFATVYYINNMGATDISSFRFYQGSDFNFNGQYSNDDDFYNQANDTVYGYYNTANQYSIHAGGFRSTIWSSAHDVNQYGTIWNRIGADGLLNGTSTNGIDGGMALAWDHGTLKSGETWVVPVIWAVGQNVSSFSSTVNYAISHNVYDVGIESIDSPTNGDSIDSISTPVVAINATVMDVGVTDQSPTVQIDIKNASGGIVYSTTTTAALSVPYAETAPVSFKWNLAGVTAGTYTVNVYTLLKNANGNNIDQNAANDMKSITVYVRNFTVYPDQSSQVSPGDNALYSLTLANMGSAGSFDISASSSTAHWPTYLYYNNTTTLLAQDYDGDGTWDWVNSVYRDVATGLPSVTLASGKNTTLLLQKLVPTTADAAVLDTTVLAANPAGQPTMTSSATLKTNTPFPSLVGKTFYMHAQTLNTTVDTATSAYKAVTSIFAMWSQAPAFADNFMISGNVTVPLYYTSTAAMPITATVFYTNGAGITTLIGTTTATLPAATTPGLYTFTIKPTSSSIVVPRGSYLVLKIDNQQTTALNVYYDSTHRTCVQVNTSTYVHVSTINTYNGTVGTSNFGPGNTMHVTANISDPIGSYDIPRANISVTAPNGTALVNNQTMTLNKTDAANPSLWKIFDYNYTLGGTLPAGVYTVTVTGYESNGVIHTKTASITLMSSTPALLVYPGNTKATTAGTVCKFKHTVTNLNSYTADTADISYTSTIPGWTVSLFKADGITPLPDTDTDGIPDTGVLTALNSTDIVVQIAVPAYANAGDVDMVTLSARSSNNVTVKSSVNDTIFISATSVVKTLYLHDKSAGAYLDTSMATSAIDHVDLAASGGVDWTQSPVFARDFNILDDPNLTLYVNSADTQVSMALKLISSNSTSSATIATLNYQAAVPKSTLTVLNFNIPLSTYNITVPAGNKLVLHIDNLDSKQLTVYGSAQYLSHFDMDTQSYINVQSVSVTDLSNNSITSATPPSSIRVFSNVTDPFGSQDIVNATLTINDGSGNMIGSPYVMAQVGVDAGSPSIWKKFESDVTLPATLDTGNYSFIVTATETNGVKHNTVTSLAIGYPVNVTADKTFMPISAASFLVTIKVTNNDAHTVNGVHAYDFYSGSFTASGFSVARSSSAVNNGIINGTVNVFGPLSLASHETKTITYTAVGSGDYPISNMYVVGVDPYA